MPQFPDSKNDILILAAKVAAGIAAHAADYPNPPFDAGLLTTLALQGADLIFQRQAKEAEAKALLDAENAKIAETIAELRRVLGLAEATYPGDAAKLQEIDWDVPSDPTHYVPGPVRNLEATNQGAGSVELHWKGPLRTSTTGKPSAYKITREVRALAEPHEEIEPFGTWQSIAFKGHKVLLGQPRGVEISYRVTASNTNGDGPPEEAERVVL